ncbi:MAG: DegV family protein [Clostridia bacterium]|nr:DegV family protein [Clostridia bacterium]
MECKVKITVDSNADLGTALLERFSIDDASVTVDVAGKNYLDRLEINSAKMFQLVEETGCYPTTAAPSVGTYMELFEKWTSQGYEVIHFNISSKLSAGHQNALIAAQDYPGVHCVDGRHLSTGYGQLAILAAEMAAQGKTAEEILEYVAGLPERVSTSFILDKLEYMAKGGRCSAVAAFGANLLKLKPCLAIRDGKLEIISKYRGSLKDVLVKYTHDRLQEAGQLDTRRAFITHTVEDPELVELVRREMLAYAPFEEIIVNDAGPGITAHCGQNCLGIMFIKAAE